MKIIIVRLQPGLINKRGMVWINNTSTILSLTRVMLQRFTIMFLQTTIRTYSK